MQDRQLYAQILGIESPWRVDRVELAPDRQEVHVYWEPNPLFSPRGPMKCRGEVRERSVSTRRAPLDERRRT